MGSFEPDESLRPEELEEVLLRVFASLPEDQQANIQEWADELDCATSDVLMSLLKEGFRALMADIEAQLAFACGLAPRPLPAPAEDHESRWVRLYELLERFYKKLEDGDTWALQEYPQLRDQLSKFRLACDLFQQVADR